MLLFQLFKTITMKITLEPVLYIVNNLQEIVKVRSANF